MVVLDQVPAEKIRTAVETREEDGDVTVHVVAPTAGVGVLQWLTGAEDDARAEAEDLASRTADAVDADVETEVGDRDPLVAVQDALVSFPADEIVLMGDAGPEIETRLRSFDLPVSHLGGGQASRQDDGRGAVVRKVARGGSPQTPLLLLGVVAGFLLCAVTLINVITFLVFWLA
jgi:hypothetical protein